jgi:hypothetical protein
MADASVTGGAQHAPGDTNQTLPSLTPAEEHAARLALSQLGSGAGTITSMAGGAATASAGTGGSDSVAVGAGSATLLAGTQHPSLLSGADSIVAGSSVPVHAAPVPGGHGSAFPVGPGHIAQAGPTAAGIQAGHRPTAAPGVTLPDKTKVNVSGVPPHDVPKHHG